MNSSPQIQDADLERIIKSTLNAIAPERASELESYWTQYAPRIQLARDGAGAADVVMHAGMYRYLEFNHRTMRLFWLSSFILWEGYLVADQQAKGNVTDITRFQELYHCHQKTLNAKDMDAVPWPNGIPAPGELVDHTEDDSGRAAGELAVFSVAWAFLHEVRHLMHQQDGTSAAPEDPQAVRNEELSCDRFATEFLLADLEAYSEQSGYKLESLQMKRQTAVFGALFAMALFGEGVWNESNTHPALQTRIEEAVAIMDGHGLSICAAAIGVSAFSTFNLMFPEAPNPLKITSVSRAFDDREQA